MYSFALKVERRKDLKENEKWKINELMRKRKTRDVI